MNKIIASFALAAALGAPSVVMASGPGTPVGIFDGDVGSFSDTSTKGGAFSDSFTFPLVAGDGFWDITAPQSTTKGISNFGISLYDGTTLETGTFTSTTLPGGVSYWTESYTDLAAGTYTLDFTGSFKTGGGSYAGNFTITPAVPEPSTWAAMAVGLLLMGSITARKQKQAR